MLATLNIYIILSLSLVASSIDYELLLRIVVHEVVERNADFYTSLIMKSLSVNFSSN